MTINFTMSEAQKKLQYDVRAFAENVLAPVVPAADREPDALKAFAMTKPAYIESYRAERAILGRRHIRSDRLSASTAWRGPTATA